MKIKLAPSLLLSVLSCSNDGVSAFSSVRPSASSRTALSMSNDFDADYNVNVDRRGNIRDISASETNRRDALARIAVTGAATVLGSNAAFAADTQFSESGISESSLLRKEAPAPVEAPPSPAQAGAPKVEAAKSSDYDGNEAGPVGPGDEGTQPSDKKVSPAAAIKSSVPTFSKLPNGYNDPKILGVAAAGTAFFGLLAVGAGGGNEEAPAITTAKGTNPPAVPYGLAGGKNYDNGGIVANPATAPKPPAAPAQAAPAVEAKPSWQLNTPTPYGIQNPAGTNPFIKEVQEFCVGGKVTDDCAKTIKGYLDTVADTGAVASEGEADAIVGYLNSLGSDSPSSPGKKKAGAAFTSYLDALSGGSAPPPSSAKAVKTYLDTLIDTGSFSESSDSPIFAAAPKESEPVAVVPEPTPEPVISTPDFSQYDSRLTSIEGRVTSLESKVDEIPDKVFEKIEAWQTQQEGKLTSEVKKIVEALTPPPAAAAQKPAAAVPKKEIKPATSAPKLGGDISMAEVMKGKDIKEATTKAEPVVSVPQPPAAVVSATPLVGEIPSRSSMPQPSSGPKKGYGLGGGASWKTNQPVASVSAPVAATPEPVAASPEPVPEPPAAVVNATPLVGEIPSRSSMPQSSGGPKKGYGLGGGASWKSTP